MTNARRVLRDVRLQLRAVRYFCRMYLALAAVRLRMLMAPSASVSAAEFLEKILKGSGKAGQGAEVILSLTSFRPRFKTLILTLECLLRQTVRPSRILLWIDEPDMSHVPEEIRRMEGRGLEIRMTPVNFRSFNKLVHTLAAFPDAIVITADDDTYYQADFVENLLGKWSGDPHEIVCNMAYAITRDENGAVKGFMDWIPLKGASYPRYDILPFGVGGVLYPPRSLGPEVLDFRLFTSLCPQADDLWFYWMARRSGVTYRKVDGHQWPVAWPSSQAIGLMYDNNAHGNDRQAAQLAAHYGWPPFDRP